MNKHCCMCGDRLRGTTDRCAFCWNTHMMIANDTKLAREVYDRYLLETSLHNKPDAFHQTLVELE